MSNLTIFNYNEHDIRTVQVDGEPWWVLKDICDVLDISNSGNVATRLDEDEKGIHTVDTLGGKQELTAISESGLYSVILLSRKPEAKQFKRWITHDVLPQIRKTGLYATADTVDKILQNPDFLIRILTDLKETRSANSALAAANEDLSVKLNDSEQFWTIMKFNQHFGLRWTMKTCQQKGKAASAYSRQHGYEIRKCRTNDDRFEHTNSYAFEVLEWLFLGGRERKRV